MTKSHPLIHKIAPERTVILGPDLLTISSETILNISQH